MTVWCNDGSVADTVWLPASIRVNVRLSGVAQYERRHVVRLKETTNAPQCIAPHTHGGKDTWLKSHWCFGVWTWILFSDSRVVQKMKNIVPLEPSWVKQSSVVTDSFTMSSHNPLQASVTMTFLSVTAGRRKHYCDSLGWNCVTLNSHPVCACVCVCFCSIESIEHKSESVQLKTGRSGLRFWRLVSCCSVACFSLSRKEEAQMFVGVSYSNVWHAASSIPRPFYFYNLSSLLANVFNLLVHSCQ